MTGKPIDFPSLIRDLEEGSLPREFVLHASRGVLPLAQEDLIAVLLVLSASQDHEIRANARKSLAEIPSRILGDFAMNQRASAHHLDLLAGVATEQSVLEGVLRNRATGDATIAWLARNVTQPLLQDVIVTNQERILRTPDILDALFANPTLSPDVRRRALEVREEFFEKAERLARLRPDTPLLEEEATAEDLDVIEDLLEKAESLADGNTPEKAAETLPATLAEMLNPDHLPAYNRILKMTISEKIRCAFKGGKSERGILIRDRNKLVCTAVLRNGRLSEQEIEGFASSRSVEEEVLRIIGSSRLWTSKYSVVLALARNPKAPPGVVVPLINRLTLKDLQNLSRDRGVAEVVRKMAWKFVQTRSKRT